VNERICIAKLEIDKEVCLTIIQIYAPINDAKEEEKKKKKIDTVLQETAEEEKGYYTILDWNGKTGQRKFKDANVGEYRMGKTNENGEMLLDYTYL